MLAGGIAASVVGRAAAQVKSGKDTIVAVERHGVLRLESGARLRLPDVLIPQIPEPYAFTVFARMKARLVGEGVDVDAGYVPADRFGVAGARFVLDDTGESVTEVLVREGLARVRPGGAMASRYFAEEDAARAQGRGLWALARYSVRSPAPDALAQDMESFQIIEGIVTDTRRKGDVTFVNFGSDWRTDTTAVVRNRALEERGIDSANLIGARVQVRGFVEMVNGPSVWVEHADALRVLD